MSEQDLIACANCGQHVASHHVYCPHCQAKLGSLAESGPITMKSMAPPGHHKLGDYLGLGSGLLGFLAITSITGSFLSALIFAAGAVLLAPKINRQLAQKMGHERFGFPARLGMGLLAFFVGAAALGASAGRNGARTTYDPPRARTEQAQPPTEQAEPVKEAAANPGAAVIVNVHDLIGKSEAEAGKVLGKPTSSEPANPSGAGCPCKRVFYRHNNHDIYIVYTSKGADWIHVSKDYMGSEAKPLTPEPAGPDTLKLIGLEPAEPDFTGPSRLSWKDEQGIVEIMVDTILDGQPEDIYLHALTE
jgi:hypothetical protein